MKLSATAERELGTASYNLLGHSIQSVVVSGSCIEVGPAFNRSAAHVVCKLPQVYVRSVHLQQSSAFNFI